MPLVFDWAERIEAIVGGHGSGQGIAGSEVGSSEAAHVSDEAFAHTWPLPAARY